MFICLSICITMFIVKSYKDKEELVPENVMMSWGVIHCKVM